MKIGDPPTAEDIKRLIENAYPDYKLTAELDVEVHEGDTYVTTSWRDEAEIRLEGDELDTILTLAERGKKAVE